MRWQKQFCGAIDIVTKFTGWAERQGTESKASSPSITTISASLPSTANSFIAIEVCEMVNLNYRDRTSSRKDVALLRFQKDRALRFSKKEIAQLQAGQSIRSKT